MPCSFGLVWLISHAESTVGWFGVREKYYLLADKSWLISQIRPSEQAGHWVSNSCKIKGQPISSRKCSRNVKRAAYSWPLEKHH